MVTTTNLGLPYIMAAQAQKHVTHNEALRALDVIVHLAVLDRDLAAPPSMPVEGERHIVAAGAIAAWSGHEGEVAAFQDGAWAFYAPHEGWLAWITAESKAVIFDSGSWVEFSGSMDINPAALVGVNATADATNKLAVKSDAVLLSHDDVTPGTGSVQLKLNKNAASATASVLYQTGWSGRAEFGTTGDDDFHVKVSSNGATWREAIVINRGTGVVSLPGTPPVASPFNLLKDAGRFSGSPEPQSATSPSFTAPTYFKTVNGSSFAQGPKFIFNNSTYGGAAGALDADVDALIVRMKDASNASWRRYSVEFYLLEVTAGNGTGTAVTVGATTYYLCMENANGPVPTQMTINFHLRVKSGEVALIHNSDEGALFVDGVPYTSHQVRTAADGWQQVTRLTNRNPRQFVGYNNVLKRLYATPGTVFYIAAPFFTPGHVPISPNLFYGVVPSLEVWR